MGPRSRSLGSGRPTRTGGRSPGRSILGTSATDRWAPCRSIRGRTAAVRRRRSLHGPATGLKRARRRGVARRPAGAPGRPAGARWLVAVREMVVAMRTAARASRGAIGRPLALRSRAPGTATGPGRPLIGPWWPPWTATLGGPLACRPGIGSVGNPGVGPPVGPPGTRRARAARAPWARRARAARARAGRARGRGARHRRPFRATNIRGARSIGGSGAPGLATGLAARLGAGLVAGLVTFAGRVRSNVAVAVGPWSVSHVRPLRSDASAGRRACPRR